jgi:hypothetical protein
VASDADDNLAVLIGLPDPLATALKAWAKAEGVPPGRWVERLLRTAVDERRNVARAELADARRTLECTTAMLTKLLEKGPGATLTPDDFADGRQEKEIISQLLPQTTQDSFQGLPRSHAVDMRAVQAALNGAGDRYRAAAEILVALDDVRNTAPSQAAEQATAEPARGIQSEPETSTPSDADPEEPHFRVKRNPFRPARRPLVEPAKETPAVVEISIDVEHPPNPVGTPTGSERQPARRIGWHPFGGKEGE